MSNSLTKPHIAGPLTKISHSLINNLDSPDEVMSTGCNSVEVPSLSHHGGDDSPRWPCRLANINKKKHWTERRWASSLTHGLDNSRAWSYQCPFFLLSYPVWMNDHILSCPESWAMNMTWNRCISWHHGNWVCSLSLNTLTILQLKVYS